jgi:translocation and assembly module TamB
VAGRVVALLDEVIAGRVRLAGIEVLPRGGIELRGLEVLDPEDHLVLSVGRARVFADLTGLRARTIGVAVELEAPSVLLEEEAGGGVSIARAFAGSRPPVEDPRAGAPGGGTAWTIRVSRLAVRRGDVWWVNAAGATRLEARDLDLDARGVGGPGGAELELRLRGALAAPVAAPVTLELAGRIADGAVRVPVLRVEVGGTSLAAVGAGDLARRSGRLAVLRLGVERDHARALAPSAPGGDDVAGAGYAESDGRTVSAAVRVEPAGDGTGGRADAAVAARLAEPGAAVGFDVALDRLDPSRLAAGAPPGALSLAARGAAAGRSREDLRARLSARLERSRLRRGEIRSAEVVLRADRGDLEVSRAVLAAPGVSLDAALRWREGGAVGGRLSADATDLALLAANAGALLGEAPPPLAGRARLEVALAGTSAAPSASATVEAPLTRIGGLSLGGLRVSADAAGPIAALSARVEGRVGSVRSGEREIARGVVVRGALAEEAGSVEASGSLPGVRDPARLEARGRLGPRRETLAVSALALAFAGARWNLVAPATVALAGPSVDRLELAAGPQRVALSGGLGPGDALDARASVERLELAGPLAGLLPAAGEVRGELSAEVRATGTPGRPELALTFAVAGGAFRGLAGVSAAGSAGWSGAARRATASVALSRGEATIDLEADLPVPIAGRPGERVHARLRSAELPLEELVAAAGGDAPGAGRVALDGALDGTAGAPTARLAATLARGAWDDLDALALEITAEGDGERLRATARAAHEGTRVLAADAEAPFDLADALARPDEALAALLRAPLEGSLAVEGLDLASLSGRAGIPAGLAGTVEGGATLGGSLARPRAEWTLGLARGAWAGYRDLSGRASGALADAAVSAAGTLAVAGGEAVRFQVSLGAPVERLASPAGVRAAALRAEVLVPGVSLERSASRDLPLGGTLSGKLTATGTPGAPEVALALAGDGVTVAGRPLGDARLQASYARSRGDATLVLSPATGGVLRATLALDADLGVGSALPRLGAAPAQLTAVTEGIDLGFLAAAAPGVVRSAGGRLVVDVRARGPLEALSPRGSLRVEEGRLAVSEYGEWTGISIEAGVTDDAVELARLEVRRGRGRLAASGTLRGLSTGPARLEARLDAEAFTVARAGMDLATLDLHAEATGGYDAGTLSVDVTVPRGVVRLPPRPPRTLQPLERRKDIVVGRPRERRGRAGAPPGPAERPFILALHLLVPRNLLVRGDDPRVDVELKADVRWAWSAGVDHAEGTVEVVRGTVEPIAGRTFTLARGRVQLRGGPLGEALLDVEARYENPAALVTLTVQGRADRPEIRLESRPPMDEGRIAMLIATGRTELKAGSGGVGTLTGEEAGRAALGALATQAFRDLVADRLPLDTVALDAGAVRAGKYVTDQIYVGYTRRFEADPSRGENPDEVRVEYQITPRWTFESRYGSAQAGGASLVWSREY